MLVVCITRDVTNVREGAFLMTPVCIMISHGMRSVSSARIAMDAMVLDTMQRVMGGLVEITESGARTVRAGVSATIPVWIMTNPGTRNASSVGNAEHVVVMAIFHESFEFEVFCHAW